MYDVFHISMLRKYEPDPLHMLHFEPIQIKDDLSYEEKPNKLLDHKEIVLRRMTIPLIKVLWQYHDGEEATWELEEDIEENYLQLFN